MADDRLKTICVNDSAVKPVPDDTKAATDQDNIIQWFLEWSKRDSDAQESLLRVTRRHVLALTSCIDALKAQREADGKIIRKLSNPDWLETKLCDAAVLWLRNGKSIDVEMDLVRAISEYQESLNPNKAARP